MNIVNRLTLRHLRLNRNRTIITVVGIILSVAMICAVAGFVFSVRDMMIRTIKETRGDYHIVYVDVTEEFASSIAREDVFGSFYTGEGDTTGLVNIYLRFVNPGNDFKQMAEAVAKEYGAETYGFNNELLALEGSVAQDNVVKAVVIIASVVIIIVVAGSVIVIANAFYISSQERVRQFGLLKSVGATGGQIGRSILFEAFVLAVVAIPIGVALGFLIQAVVLFLTNELLRELSAMNNNSMNFHVFFSPYIVLISVGISVLTLLISAWLPARRAAKASPIDSIRRTGDVRIRSRRLRTSRLTQKLFGFEGTLAAKSLKRSRGKYRATVVSLTVSIVLFVSVSSFIWVLSKGVEMEYGGLSFDVLINVNDDMHTTDEVERLLYDIPDAEVNRISRMLLDCTVPDGFITERALNSMTEENGYGLLLYMMPDDVFAKTVPETQDKLAGILINTTGTVNEGDKIREAIPYECQVGTELFFDDKSVTVAAIRTEIPDSIPAGMFAGGMINILIPETAFRELFPSIETLFAVTAKNPEKFCEAAEETLQTVKGVRIWDISRMTRLNRNITLVVSIFGYGFISMLTLIAVTSVIATISTGMALRRQEFAMLYSVGMTGKGMNRMLDLESLLYGTKSLVIGLPIGLALSYLIYTAMANVAVFAWRPLWEAMIISVVAVMLLTFGTMRYSKEKLNKVSIVEAIRNERS